jgi:hypothetical protein
LDHGKNPVGQDVNSLVLEGVEYKKHTAGLKLLMRIKIRYQTKKILQKSQMITSH